MKLKFNVLDQHDEFTQAMGQILRTAPIYLVRRNAGLTGKCTVGPFTVDSDGVVSWKKNVDNDVVKELLKGLEVAGFTPISADEQTLETESNSNEQIDVIIEMPKDLFEEEVLQKLTKLVEIKGDLIKKALGTDCLPIEVSNEKITFPWFKAQGASEDIAAYTHFVTALCEMAKNQKRINANEKEIENEKYAFRCFLLRLGFIGNEYKEERKILLRNLTGSSAFKGGIKHEISK